MFDKMIKLFAASHSNSTRSVLRSSRISGSQPVKSFDDLEERIVPANFTWDAGDNLASLNADIAVINMNGVEDNISFDANVTFSGALTAFTADGGNAVNIDGGGFNLTQTSGVDRVLLNDGATLNIDALTITGGSVAGDGGGIFNMSGVLSLTNSTITGNQTTGAVGGGNSGGGILNNATIALIQYSTISNNYTVDDGGGISNQGTITEISFSTISGNSTPNSAVNAGGGGITNTGTITLIANSTISGNIDGSSSAIAGGGIVNFGPLTEIVNSTITDNQSPSSAMGSGGIRAGVQVGNVESTIVAGNTNMGGDADVTGTMTNAADNIFGTSSGLMITNDNGGNQLDVDPMLGPLADNGGPTETHALTAGSSALGAGNNNAMLMFDQRGPGFPRVVDGGVDVGALQFSTPTPPTPPAPPTPPDNTFVLSDDGQTLTVNCTPNADVIELSSGSTVVSVNGVSRSFVGLTKVVINALPGNDVIRFLDALPDIAFEVNGDAGFDMLDFSPLPGLVTAFSGPDSGAMSSFDSIEFLKNDHVIFLPGADLNGTVDNLGGVLDFSRLPGPIDVRHLDIINGGIIKPPLFYVPAFATPPNSGTVVGLETPTASPGSDSAGTLLDSSEQSEPSSHTDRRYIGSSDETETDDDGGSNSSDETADFGEGDPTSVEMIDLALSEAA